MAANIKRIRTADGDARIDYNELANLPVIDQYYNPSSENALSGKAVGEGIEATANGLQLEINEAKEEAQLAYEVAQRADVYSGETLTNRINDLEAQVGDVDAALDELHTYAQALINGGEA